MDQSKRSFRIVMTTLISLGTLLLMFDLYEIIAGKVDLNQHLPLLFPGLLFAFAYACCHYRIQVFGDDPDTTGKRRNQAGDR